MRTAYSVDIIAVDEEGRLIFIEVKTGHKGGLFVSDASSQWLPGSPFAGRNWPCTPRNRAIVQSTAGTLMAVNNLSLPAEAYLVYVAHVDNLRVRFTHVAHEFLCAEGPGLFIYLRQVREQDRREKRDERAAARAGKKKKTV